MNANVVILSVFSTRRTFLIIDWKLKLREPFWSPCSFSITCNAAVKNTNEKEQTGQIETIILFKIQWRQFKHFYCFSDIVLLVILVLDGVRTVRSAVNRGKQQSTRVYESEYGSLITRKLIQGTISLPVFVRNFTKLSFSISVHVL